MRILPLTIRILLESSPLKSRILVRRLAVHARACLRGAVCFSTFDNMLKLTTSPQAKRAETDPRQGTPTRGGHTYNRLSLPPQGGRPRSTLLFSVNTMIISSSSSRSTFINIIIIIIKSSSSSSTMLFHRCCYGCCCYLRGADGPDQHLISYIIYVLYTILCCFYVIS